MDDRETVRYGGANTDADNQEREDRSKSGRSRLNTFAVILVTSKLILDKQPSDVL